MQLSLQNINKQFHQQSVIHDLNLIVEAGDFIHIAGSNGSGKSTIFKMICNIIEPTSGTIVIDDDVHLGALIENPGFMENSDVKTNLKFLANIKHHYNERTIAALLDDFNLDLDNKLKLKKYSLGMRQKVGIIQAVMENQNFILLDEPSRGLDKKAQQHFADLMNRLVAEQKTVIIASHDDIDLGFNRRFELIDGRLNTL